MPVIRNARRAAMGGDGESAGEIYMLGYIVPRVPGKIEISQPSRVNFVDGIIANINIKFDLIVVSDGIRLHKPPERGRVEPGLVVVHAELAEPGLSRILKPSLVARAGGPVFVIGIDRGRAAVRVGDRDDRSLVVSVEERAGVP